MSDDRIRPKITFITPTEKIICPICGEIFFQEKLMSSGGRLIAGDITDKLHRTYKPSANFGKIYPLVYSIMVCPTCYYAALPMDFDKIPRENIKEIESQSQERIDYANKLSGIPVDFSKYRTLESGAASFALAAECYENFNKKFLPVIKQAICLIRAAFLYEDLNKEKPNRYFGYLGELFYRKALFMYEQAFELNRKKEQIMENMKFLGPDIDKDYGYDGLTYLNAVLLYYYGDKSDPEKRKKDMEKAKLYFGKLFGMGKSNINKPKEILDKSKDFYDIIVKELKEIQ